jgi:acylphosphatase
MHSPLTSAAVEIRRRSFVICRKCLVSGRVQGVFYRATTAHRARELGIRGYANNLPDGRVEVLACGDAEVVEEFVQWLWKGSAASKVTAVAVEELDPASIQSREGFRTG